MAFIDVPDVMETSGRLRPDEENLPYYTPGGKTAIYSRFKLQEFVQAAYDGNTDLLARMVDREDPVDGYHDDINEHLGTSNALHLATVNGMTECVQMLLTAKADPHVKMHVPVGKDPEDGETALMIAEKWGWDDIVEMLKKAEAETPKGVYFRYGRLNNAKLYPMHMPNGLDPAQEKRAKEKLKGMQRPLPNKVERKFYGDKIFGVTHGFDPEGRKIKYPYQPVIEGWWPEARAHFKDVAVVGSIAGIDSAAIGLLFPGQGSQTPGMLTEAAKTPKVQEMLAIASKTMGFDVLEACGDAAQLEDIAVTQAIIFVADMAGLEKLRVTNPEAAENPSAVAGLSIGEFAALTVAGVFDFEVAMDLVKVRAEAVKQASQASPQAMCSVAGIEKANLSKLCEQIADTTKSTCVIANELFPKGMTCSGSLEAMEKLKDIALKNGSLQSKLLAKSGAYHSVFMDSAKKILEAELKKALPKMSPPKCDIYLNCSGAVFTKGSPPKDLIPMICNQLTSCVKWETCVKSMINAGIAEFFEVGPGKQLKAMMKRIDAPTFAKTGSVEV